MKEELWSYEGHTGPLSWKNLEQNELSVYEWQSPIALSRKECGEKKINEGKLTFDYLETIYEVHYFTYTIHLIPKNKTNRVKFEEEWYSLQDIHFHIPSEHIIEEKQWDLECHLVHMNSAGQRLVIGTMFTLPTSLQKLGRDLIEDDTISFDARRFLPENQSYFHYTGSLTTPPTEGPILWLVMDQAQVANDLIMHLIQTVAKGNARPIQDVNTRLVVYFPCH